MSRKQPPWIRRGNTIVASIVGGAFLGALIAKSPGAIVGAIVGGYVGFCISKENVK